MIAKEKITLTLPFDLMEAVRHLAGPRQQSQFIAEAIAFFIAEKQRKTLRERLMAGYQANAAADAAVAAEWSVLEDEAWFNNVYPYEVEIETNDSTGTPTNSAR
jgi:metal-responsive CopG/Arc/MetJ family transcriptional regulator